MKFMLPALAIAFLNLLSPSVLCMQTPKWSGSPDHPSSRPVERLKWVHVPKCGSSFVNTLITWGCPGIAEDEVITSYDLDSVANGPAIWMQSHSSACSDKLDISCEHAPISSTAPSDSVAFCVEEEGVGFAAMFRQPEQRILSGFHHYNLPWGAQDSTTEGDYAKLAAGCSTNMLIGRGCMSTDPLTPEDDAAAKGSLEKFAFVGLTEEWDLSVCLFHKIFGTDCNRREFQNIRPGVDRASNGDQYDVSVLNGFVDEHDGVLYKEASRIFKANLVLYGVTKEFCDTYCKEPATRPKE